ncbi:MAG: hypothetical protein AAB966_00690, partial [Patescibacteria group bacterium]
FDEETSEETDDESELASDESYDTNDIYESSFDEEDVKCKPCNKDDVSSSSSKCEDDSCNTYLAVRNSDLSYQSIFNSETKIIDFVWYSTYIIALLENQTILQLTYDPITTVITDMMTISSNQHLTNLTVYAGFLYGLDSGTGIFYELGGTSFGTTVWSWSAKNIGVTDITYINSTLDGSFLWVQDATTGYLFTTPNFTLSTSFAYANSIRVYGLTSVQFVDITTTAHIATLMPGATTTLDVDKGAVMADGSFVYTPYQYINQQSITLLKIVNWLPVYGSYVRMGVL